MDFLIAVHLNNILQDDESTSSLQKKMRKGESCVGMHSLSLFKNVMFCANQATPQLEEHLFSDALKSRKTK